MTSINTHYDVFSGETEMLDNSDWVENSDTNCKMVTSLLDAYLEDDTLLLDFSEEDEVSLTPYSDESESCTRFYGLVEGINRNTWKDTEYYIKYEDRTELFHAGDSTLIYTDEDTVGTYVYVISRIGGGNNYNEALAICSEEFYDVFSEYDSLTTKVYKMRKFLKLSEGQQKSVFQQCKGKRYCSEETPEACQFISLEDLKFKYELCRDTYTPLQQKQIEMLLDQRAKTKTNKEKDLVKLKYILNISPVYAPRKCGKYDEVMGALNSHLNGMEKVKRKVAEFIVSSKYTEYRGLKLLLVGNPGTGKTTIAMVIAEIFGIPFDIINLSAASSAIDIKGLDSSYDGSDSGVLIKSFYKLGTTEAVIVLDEIDKMGTSLKDGSPYNALCDTLSDVNECYDVFLDVGIDTRNTVYIATANSTDDIPDFLLNRFEVIRIDDYHAEEKVSIAKDFIIPQTREMFNIPKKQLEFSQGAIETIVKEYCSDAGVRMLRNNIESITRRILKEWDDKGSRKKVKVTEEYVRAILEPIIDAEDLGLKYTRNREKYSEEVRTEISETLRKLTLRNISPDEKETQRTRARYLTSMIPDPRGFEDFDIDKFSAEVNESHFGLDEVKNRIAACFHARALMHAGFSSIRIMLEGGAGIGKTSICQSIAKGLGIPYIRISLNGVSDMKVLKGMPYSYKEADAGEIIRGLYRAGTTRALIQLDEVDKMGADNGVRTDNVLLDLLDDAMTYTDRFLEVPVDLSSVLFIATANDTSRMAPWLLDRFEVIKLDGYTRSEKKQILSDYVLPELEHDYAGGGLSIEMGEKAAGILVNEYCLSMGVRDIKESVRKVVEDKLYLEPLEKNVHITENDIARSLGAKPVPRGNIPNEIRPGFAKGLAVTSGNVGIASSIECAILPGSKETIITGLPKESTIDSVKLAATYIRLNYSNGEECGFHLHFGEGAVEKDGPSAGVAILISMLSAYTDTPVSVNASYTGEINLFGDVFAIGGTLSKIQAAEQTGCSMVFIPKDNYDRLSKEDLSRFSLKIIPVSNVSTVIETVLPGIIEDKTVRKRGA